MPARGESRVIDQSCALPCIGTAWAPPPGQKQACTQRTGPPSCTAPAASECPEAAMHAAHRPSGLRHASCRLTAVNRHARAPCQDGHRVSLGCAFLVQQVAAAGRDAAHTHRLRGMAWWGGASQLVCGGPNRALQALGASCSASASRLRQAGWPPVSMRSAWVAPMHVRQAHAGRSMMPARRHAAGPRGTPR